MAKIPAPLIRDLHLLFLGISVTDFVCLHLSIKSLIPSSEINIPYLFAAFCEVMIYFFLVLCGNSLKRFTILILSNIVSLGIFYNNLFKMYFEKDLLDSIIYIDQDTACS